MGALGGKLLTAQGNMTEGRRRPDIVHRPDHRLPALQDLLNPLERKHTLIDPMQVDDISLLEFRQLRDIRARIGDIDLKQMLTGEMQATEDHQPLP